MEKSKLTYEFKNTVDFDAGYGCGYRYNPDTVRELYVQNDIPAVQEKLQNCSYIEETVHADDLVSGNIVTLNVSKNNHKYFGENTPFFVVETGSSENTLEEYKTNNACLLGPIHEERLHPRLVYWYENKNNSIVGAEIQKLRNGGCSQVHDFLVDIPDKIDKSIPMYFRDNERQFSMFKVQSRTLIKSRNHINPILDRDLANTFNLNEALFLNL